MARGFSMRARGQDTIGKLSRNDSVGQFGSTAASAVVRCALAPNPSLSTFTEWLRLPHATCGPRGRGPLRPRRARSETSTESFRLSSFHSPRVVGSSSRGDLELKELWPMNTNGKTLRWMRTYVGTMVCAMWAWGSGLAAEVGK